MNFFELREAEDIKKRWQEYTELYKKDHHDPDNHDGMITHPNPDTLECEVKWALGSLTMNKTNGSGGIPAELLQILKGCCESAALTMPANLENSAVATGWKCSVFIPIPNKGNTKECSNYCIIMLISHASKVMLKSFKLGFSSM